jgi:hypothetical protein
MVDLSIVFCMFTRPGIHDEISLLRMYNCCTIQTPKVSQLSKDPNLLSTSRELREQSIKRIPPFTKVLAVEQATL